MNKHRREEAKSGGTNTRTGRGQIWNDEHTDGKKSTLDGREAQTDEKHKLGRTNTQTG